MMALVNIRSVSYTKPVLSTLPTSFLMDYMEHKSLLCPNNPLLCAQAERTGSYRLKRFLVFFWNVLNGYNKTLSVVYLADSKGNE